MAEQKELSKTSGFGDKKFSFGKPQTGSFSGPSKHFSAGFGNNTGVNNTATTKTFGFKKGGGGCVDRVAFGTAKRHVDPTPHPVTSNSAPSETPEPVTIVHDIADVSGIKETLAAHPLVTLRLTNDTQLRGMPIIQFLPQCVQKVELDSSCACITKIERSEKFHYWRDHPGFLKFCHGLREVDLSVMTNLTHFGDNFLAGCGDLTSLKLPILQQEAAREVAIGSHFLYQARKLEQIDLSNFFSLEAIPSSFLCMNSSLVEVVFPAMPRLRKIGQEFLFDCDQLQRVVFTVPSEPSSTVECFIAECFLKRCARLEELDLTPLFAEGSSLSIDSEFCSECRSLHTVSLPTSSITNVGSHFLSDCSSLTVINLEFFRGQTKLPDHFLAGCKSLKALDLSPMKNIRTIGHLVFAGCTSIVTLDMSSMDALTAIGRGFARGCEALESIVFSPRAQFTVNHDFLYDCTHLQFVDLSCLASMTTVPANFLCGCSAMKSIDLTPLAGVTAIGPGFLYRQTCLKSVHLPFTSAITVINGYFLAECPSLETVTISPALHAAQSVTAVGSAFCAKCVSLQSIDLQFLGNATSIDSDFLRGCKALVSVDTAPLSNVEKLGDGFLQHCTNVKELDVGFLQKVTIIPSNFLSECSALCHIHNLDVALRGVAVVRGHFLRQCSLEAIELSSLDEVEEIGGYCLAECSELKSVIMPARLTKLKSIGSHLLFRDKALTELILPNLAPQHSLTIGEEFLSWCTALTAVDLRFLANAEFGHLLTGCTPDILKAILIVVNGKAPTSFRTQSRVLLHLPDALQRNAIECEAGDAEGRAAVPQVPWSWKHHTRHPKGVQLAALWMFRGLQYQHPIVGGAHEPRYLPAEVAYEICCYISTPATELTSAEKASGGFNFARKDGFVFVPKKRHVFEKGEVVNLK